MLGNQNVYTGSKSVKKYQVLNTVKNYIAGFYLNINIFSVVVLHMKVI